MSEAKSGKKLPPPKRTAMDFFEELTMSDSNSAEERVLVYDYVDSQGDFIVDREPRERDESYYRRTALYNNLFNRR